MSSDVLLVEKRPGLRILTLNRPEKLNAFNIALHMALRKALDEAGEDEHCRAILITGAGRGFCAGQDLSDRRPSLIENDHDPGSAIEDWYNPLVRQIRALEMPVVCAVNGVAAGAGANVALACDIVIAAKSARFIQAFSKIGLVPDSGGTWTLPNLVGEARAKGLAFTAMPLKAKRAEKWGMIWRAVDDDQLINEATDLAEMLARGPTHSLALAKKAIHAAATNSLDQQLDVECAMQREVAKSSDYKEGVSAFLEKRQPVFSGKKDAE